MTTRNEIVADLAAHDRDIAALRQIVAGLEQFIDQPGTPPSLRERRQTHTVSLMRYRGILSEALELRKRIVTALEKSA